MIDNTQPREIGEEMTQWIDKAVFDLNGERIGRVNNIVEHDGEVFAILDLSETTNSADSLYAVPWSSLNIDHEDGPRTAIAVDESKLKDARVLEGADFKDLAGEDWNSSIFVYSPQIHWPS